MRDAKAAANHDAFLAAACLGFVALLVVLLLMPRPKHRSSSGAVVTRRDVRCRCTSPCGSVDKQRAC
ncbi:hypothetical protein QMK19_19600 [Streptomyces sp. H10-C2]|uniref:hypothetical protein n=1 Tax=unclassified Streptomyces TaxID=2593676 RepID=UPI0024B950D0|nr:MULTISPECIES: hypothetical protein [unclassified Streptomyces]MDJ0343368.1 hypothetical protein [Streptomyces sp. PH10-H1]MDJ0371821.1 hypothetical protein [Streptomyces sp. H10-C2]